jgi:hypothetical protein
MEDGLKEEDELRWTLLKTLRSILYNSAFNKHMLDLYAQVIYKPLDIEKKIEPVKPLVNPKVESKSKVQQESEVILVE